jgi:hypothetical protein
MRNSNTNSYTRSVSKPWYFGIIPSMEKYNIPEKHSLDSMEGIEVENNPKSETLDNLEISSEIEKMVMRKVKDIFEYGQAISGLGGDIIWGGDSPNARIDDKSVKLSPDNIRRYYLSNEELKIPSVIRGIFQYGLQSRMDPANKSISTNYLEYRQKTKAIDEAIDKSEQSTTANWDCVFFQVEGRSHDVRNEYSGIKFSDVALMFELPKDTFIIDQQEEKAKEVLAQEKRGNYSQYDVVKKRLKLGEFSTSTYGWVNHDTMNFFHNNPDLKIRDERIIKEIKRQKEEGIFNGLYRNFNDKGDFINHRDLNVNAFAEGLMTPKRIAPRKFQGLIVGSSSNSKEVFYEDVVNDGEKDVSDIDLFEYTKKFVKMIELNDPNALSIHFNNLVIKVVQVMLIACKENPEKVVPVYDRFGNLLWPKRMSHEEIVKMKAEEKTQDTQG